MSRLQICILVIPATIGSIIGTISTINEEIKTIRHHKFKIVPDIFQVGGRISLGAGTGAICGILWPFYGGLAAYNFIDEQSKLG
jgi:hypothetical protein